MGPEWEELGKSVANCSVHVDQVGATLVSCYSVHFRRFLHIAGITHSSRSFSRSCWQTYGNHGLFFGRRLTLSQISERPPTMATTCTVATNEYDHSWFDFAVLRGSRVTVHRQQKIQIVDVSPRR